MATTRKVRPEHNETRLGFSNRKLEEQSSVRVDHSFALFDDIFLIKSCTVGSMDGCSAIQPLFEFHQKSIQPVFPRSNTTIER